MIKSKFEIGDLVVNEYPVWCFDNGEPLGSKVLLPTKSIGLILENLGQPELCLVLFGEQKLLIPEICVVSVQGHNHKHEGN